MFSNRNFKKWDRNSEAGRFLRQGLENGDIDPSLPPKQIYDQFPVFQQFDLTKFRAALNKAKTDLGCQVRGKSIWVVKFMPDLIKTLVFLKGMMKNRKFLLGLFNKLVKVMP